MTSTGDRQAILYIGQNMLDGRCYVGITVKPLRRRVLVHLAAANRGVGGRFYNAIRKHGAENFEFWAIERLQSYKEAGAAERAFIEKYSPAYNVTKGGEGALGYRHTPEDLEIMRQRKLGKPGPWRGKTRPPETVEKFRARMLANPLNYWVGKKRDEETKQKISRTKKGCAAPPSTPLMEATRIQNCKLSAIKRRKQVRCLSDGKLYESAQAASLAYGFCKTAVAGVCRPGSKCKAVYGLRFAYLEDVPS